MIEITDEEADKAVSDFQNADGDFRQSMKIALADFLANRPAPVATLRPVAELSETATEGWFRVFAKYHKADQCWIADQNAATSDYTHAADIQLPTAPDPEADLRREFEEAMKKDFSELDFKRDEGTNEYINLYMQCAFDGWMRCKELTKVK